MRHEFRIIFTIHLAALPIFGLCSVYGKWMNVNMEPGLDPLPLPSLKHKPANKIFCNNACSRGVLMNRVSTLVKTYLPLRYNFGGSFSPCCSSSSSATDSFSVCMKCNPPSEMHMENLGWWGTFVCTGSLICKWLNFGLWFCSDNRVAFLKSW